MKIRSYTPADASALIVLLQTGGDDWACYHAPENRAGYLHALAGSITYIAWEDGRAVGYSRSIHDNGLYIYVCDLLVAPAFRRRGIGRRLMEQVCRDHPHTPVYVMSDTDEYYAGQGYPREGSVFRISAEG